MPGIVLFNLIYFSILTLISVVMFDPIHATVSMMIILATYISFRYSLLSVQSLFVLPIAAVFYMAGSFGLYDDFYYYDKVVHFLVSFAVTYFIGSIIQKSLFKNNTQSWLFFIIVVSLGFAVGSLWEVFEWIMGFVVPHELIRGVDDTITDLIVDLLGAVCAVIVKRKIG